MIKKILMVISFCSLLAGMLYWRLVPIFFPIQHPPTWKDMLEVFGISFGFIFAAISILALSRNKKDGTNSG